MVISVTAAKVAVMAVLTFIKLVLVVSVIREGDRHKASGNSGIFLFRLQSNCIHGNDVVGVFFPRFDFCVNKSHLLEWLCRSVTVL